jgi:hypothetical protein
MNTILERNAMDPDALAEVRELAELERQGWPLRLKTLAAAGVLVAATPGMTAQPDPFGVMVDADGRVVVDDFTNPISNIPEIVRAFTADNMGYWIERVYNSPGWTIQGGAVRYVQTHPGDFFLPAGSLPAPRAPGTEAPRISGTRRRPIVAYPESLSASLEVTDEARRRNDVLQVQTTFRQAANTFADTFQSIGEAALATLVTTASRFVTGAAGTFADWDAAAPVENVNSTAPRPAAEFARVARLFTQDKSGVQPDTLIMSPEDQENLIRVYGGSLDATLTRLGIRQTLVSTRRAPGARLYLRSGQVGTMAWEKPLGDPEYTREGVRYTDVYTMEGVVAFIANGADALLEVRKV